MQCTKAEDNVETQYSRIEEVRLGRLGGGTGRDLGLPSSSAPAIVRTPDGPASIVGVNLNAMD